MNFLKYKIKSFDHLKKLLVVDFGLDGWASISLTSPLPKNKEELESIIKRYAVSYEQAVAIHEPVDMSYIDSLIGQDLETTRFRLQREILEPTLPTEEEMAELEALESAHFEEKVLEILHKLGVIK